MSILPPSVSEDPLNALQGKKVGLKGITKSDVLISFLKTCD